MCLLHTHTAATSFNFADIADFFHHNPDGAGVMRAENGVLLIEKSLPKNAKEAWDFYQLHAQGRDCVVHWRLKTHGKVDKINCHPYNIFDASQPMPMAVMHNGILQQGNEKNKDFSDTWHYVNDTLVPLLMNTPSLFNTPQFIDVIEAHIGSGNRLILMNNLGETAIMNEHQFVEYKGAKLSNLYAWDSAAAGYGFKSKYKASSSNLHWSNAKWDNEEDDYLLPGGAALATTGDKFLLEDEDEASSEAESIFEALSFHGFDEAYDELGLFQMCNFIDINGVDAAWEAFDALEAEVATEDEFIKYIKDGSTKKLLTQLMPA